MGYKHERQVVIIKKKEGVGFPYRECSEDELFKLMAEMLMRKKTK